MKRIISIVVTLAFILTAIAVPVLAVDEYTTPGPPVFNILDRYSYYSYGNDFVDSEQLTRSFRFTGYSNEDPSSFYMFGLTPDLDASGNFSLDFSYIDVGILTFTFISSVVVHSVSINYYDLYNEFYDIKGNLVSDYTIPGVNETLHIYTYQFDVYDFVSDLMIFQFATDEYYDCYFEAISLYRDSYNKRIMPIMSLDAYGTMFNSQDNSYYQQRYFYDHSFVPGDNINITGDSGIVMPEDDRLSVFIDFDSGYVGADKFTMSMITTGVWDNYYDYGSASEAGILVKYGDVDSFNIPVNTYFTKAEGLSWQGLPVYYVSFVADLNSYDLSDAELTLNFIINGRYPSRQGSIHVDYFFRVENVFFYFGEDEYRSDEDRFFHRLDQWFHRAFGSYFHIFEGYWHELLTDNDNIFAYFRNFEGYLNNIWTSINNNFTNLVAVLRTHFTSVDGWFNNIFSQIESKFYGLFEKLEEYFGVPENTAPPDSSDQQQGIEDSIGEMDGIADQFGTAGDQIDQLLPDTPNYDDTGLAGNADLAATHISYVLMVFNPLWENEFIITLLTFSCMLALGGFILFGER